MENSANVSTVVLSVNINCCNACPKKAQKLLLKVAGVLSVVVDPEKNLVHVTGKADTKLLIKAISKMKKKVEVVPNKTKNEEKKDANQEAEKGNKSECSNIVQANYVPPKTGFVQEFWNVDNGNNSEFPNNNQASYGPPGIGFGQEFCVDPYHTMHNHQGYMQQMHPMAYYNYAPWRQNECCHSSNSMMAQGNCVNYPGQYRPPGCYDYNNFF